MSAVTVFLGLGSNLGNRQRNIERAAELLDEALESTQLSTIYSASPMYEERQPEFLNAVLMGTTQLPPMELLALVKQLEADMGRTPGPKHGPRILDIDILFYGDQVIDMPTLTIPHPSIPERPFVLVPLSEIAPDVRHPVIGSTPAEMLKRMGRPGDVLPFDAEAAYWAGLKRGRQPIPLRDSPG